MNQLNGTQKKIIEDAKNYIKSFQIVQDLVYENLVKILELDNDWLFDYIYNCEEADDYTSFIKSKLYGSQE
jgi:hypothetical protein